MGSASLYRCALEIWMAGAKTATGASKKNFNHVWGGGYAAGYYSYLWTEVLAVNIADGS